MKASPVTWLNWVIFWAFIASIETTTWLGFIAHVIALVFLAGSGGQLAIENVKWRMMRGQAKDI